MRIPLFCRVVSAAATVALAGPCLAQETPTVRTRSLTEAEQKSMPTLVPGDRAPAIGIGKWLKGEPVGEFERGKIYVVEFWATWCVPCIKSMPHLAEVQKRYADKGVAVISVTTGDERNTLEKAEAMVREKADVMAYRVAWDDGLRTHDAYMRAARRTGIPCAFVIDGEGVLAWIGHPMKLEAALDGVLSGAIDVGAEAAALRDGWSRLIAGNKALAEFEAAKKAGDWEAALKASDAMTATGLDAFSSGDCERFEILLVRLKDPERAYPFARSLMDGVDKDDARALGRIAWTIAAFDGIERRDLDLAMAAAARAVELDPTNPYTFRALAAVHFRKGEREKAVETATRACEVAKFEWDKPALEQALRWVKGEAATPFRE